MLEIYDISVNGVNEPEFIPCGNIRVGWKLNSSERNVVQQNYRITVKTVRNVFDSGVVKSSRSYDIPADYSFKPDQDYKLTVSVTDNYGEKAEKTITFGTGLIKTKGFFIRPSRHIEGWAPYIRRRFVCSGDIERAVLYVSGLGCGEYYINGRKISDDLIDPPMTNYEREVFYRAYNIREYLCAENAFTALLGEGWYSQSRVWGPGGFKYGNVTLWAQLEIRYADGRHESIYTGDGSEWKYIYSPVTMNNLYGGETYDCRLEVPGFADYNGSDDGWGETEEDPVQKGPLKFCRIPAVRIIKELKPVSVTPQSGESDGAWIIDMGENVAGFAEFRLPFSARGQMYVFRFAETINKDGSLDFRSAGTFATQVLQQDIYISRGDPQGEVYRPRFTYHAFRYIEISGCYYFDAYGKKPECDIAVGYQISTDLRDAGKFSCSDDDINKLQNIMMSTFRSNYHGFPEDCPGREKCGWLGDAQVVCNTGMMNYDMQAAYTKYVNDIRTQTEVYGTWCMIAPGKRGCGEASPLWGCAQIIIPYYMYKYYGDTGIIKNNWDMMTAWVEHEKSDAKDYIITRGLGDWCPPGGEGSDRRIPVEQSSTAMFYEICVRMAELCDEFGYESKAYYSDLSEKIKNAFIAKYYLPEAGRYSTWGASGVALTLGLYPDGCFDSLLAAAVKQIEDDGFAMSTGIYGNKYLIPVLCENGYYGTAHKILFNRSAVSFATMMDDGATSLWESLDMVNIGTPRDKSTASYNHPMHSGFAYYLYEQLAGIRPLKPGYSEFEFRPCNSDLDHISAWRDTPAGKINVEINRKPGCAEYIVTVPANSVCVYNGNRFGSGEYRFTAEN